MGNKHADKKLHAGRRTVEKIVVADVKERGTNHVKAQIVARTDRELLQKFVTENTEKDSTAYTDEANAYKTPVDINLFSTQSRKL